MMDTWPSGAIANFTMMMSEGDLPALQSQAQGALWMLGPSQAQLAYEVAREIHPSAPSLRELMAFDHQDPSGYRDPLLAQPSPSLGNQTVAEYLQQHPWPAPSPDQDPHASSSTDS